MRPIAADDWHGLHGESLSGFGRYVDDDHVRWRIETDGNGGTVPIREGYVGPSAFELDGERRLHERLQREAESARRKYPDPRAGIVALLKKRPRTTRELAWKIGRGHQHVTDMLGRLRSNGLVRWEYTSDPNASTTEHLWSLVPADLP